MRRLQLTLIAVLAGAVPACLGDEYRDDEYSDEDDVDDDIGDDNEDEILPGEQLNDGEIAHVIRVANAGEIQQATVARQRIRTEIAIDFADKDSETGLGEGATPAATVTITFKDGKSVKLLVGKTQKGTNRFVKKADDATVWVISSWSADWATADEKKFEKKDEKKDGPPGGDPHGDDHGMPGMPEGLDMEDLQMPDE